jgi:cell volume regulation protein A
MIETMLLAILIGAGLLVVSILTSLIAFRVGAPLLLVFLGLGLLVGENGLGIRFDNAPAAYFIGSVALAIILFDSGFATRWQTFRTAAAPAIVLATVGVALTAALLAVGAHYLLGLPWLEALLIGAIVGSTDAAAVFFLLRIGGITIRERVRATLEVESGSNDPMAIFLVVVLVQLIAAGAGIEQLTWSFVQEFALQMGLGLALGLAGGFGIVQGVNRAVLEPGLYPLVVLGSALVLFAVTGLLGGSGFLAVYVAGLVAGNMRLRGGLHLRRFQEGMTWLSQIVMFLTLGLLATPAQFLGIAAPVLALALVLMLVARPLAVALCLLPFRFQRREILFVGWVGLRGAVSILLAILPILGGLERGQMLFNSAFMIVLVSLLVQGWTIRPMARWLGLTVPPTVGPVDKVELELPGAARHELVVYRIAPESPVARGERIPRWARPSLVIRDGRSMRIHQAGRLQPGDHVYIFTVPTHLHLLDRLFASPTGLDRLDTELYGDLAIAPGARMAELSRAYGLWLGAVAEQTAVADYLGDQLGGAVEVGDRLALGGVDLVVRKVDETGAITAIGLALAPSLAMEEPLSLLTRLRRLAIGRPRKAEPPAGSGQGSARARLAQPGKVAEATAAPSAPGKEG